MASPNDLLERARDAIRTGRVDWRHWTTRWDRMQERYLVRRQERVALLVGLVGGTQARVSRLLDLGCGTGSLTSALLDAFPQALAVGIDFDPVVLPLAEQRLAHFGARAQLVLADLRGPLWAEGLPVPFDAVVSATALHWLRPEELTRLYRQLAELLRPGGIFLNADHAGSDCPAIQQAWERCREEMRRQEGRADADDWSGFWSAYAHALGLDLCEAHRRVLGGWDGGVEEGLPIAWHFEQLRASGFSSVDCFWRCDCDAIYGGIRT